jgi:hypothetical protein
VLIDATASSKWLGSSSCRACTCSGSGGVSTVVGRQCVSRCKQQQQQVLQLWLLSLSDICALVTWCKWL